MGPPSIWHRFRQLMGRAFRETGQALDRLGMRGIQHATTLRRLGDDPYRFDDHLSRHRHQMPLIERGAPQVSPDAAFLAPCSTLIGTVHVAKDASIWYKAILRADQFENGSSFQLENPQDEPPPRLDESRMEKFERRDGIDPGGGIYIGEGSNVQDGAIITSNVDHTIIGKGVTIGHSAQIDSATVHDYALIGMGSVLNPGVVVETEAFIAAGAVVEKDTLVNAGELWVGQPARKLRDLSSAERERLHYQSSAYVDVAQSQAHIAELGGNLEQLPSLPSSEELLSLTEGADEGRTAEVPESANQHSQGLSTEVPEDEEEDIRQENVAAMSMKQ